MNRRYQHHLCVRFNFQAVTSASFLILNQFTPNLGPRAYVHPFLVHLSPRSAGERAGMWWTRCLCCLEARMEDPIRSGIPFVFHQILYSWVVFVFDCWWCAIFNWEFQSMWPIHHFQEKLVWSWKRISWMSYWNGFGVLLPTCKLRCYRKSLKTSFKTPL